MDELYAATMDVIQKYGQVQFNLGQMNMLNASGLPGEVHWEEARRKARANSESALRTLDDTVRAMCRLPEEPRTHRAKRARPSWDALAGWEELEVDDGQYSE